MLCSKVLLCLLSEYQVSRYRLFTSELYNIFNTFAYKAMWFNCGQILMQSIQTLTQAFFPSANNFANSLVKWISYRKQYLKKFFNWFCAKYLQLCISSFKSHPYFLLIISWIIVDTLSHEHEQISDGLFKPSPCYAYFHSQLIINYFIAYITLKEQIVNPYFNI